MNTNPITQEFKPFQKKAERLEYSMHDNSEYCFIASEMAKKRVNEIYKNKTK